MRIAFPAISLLSLSWLLALPMGPVPAFAQAGPTTLSPVVVTGTRSDRPIDEAPVRTEVIDQAEITRTGAITLKDALENLPGVHLTEVHGKSGYQLSMQGFGGDQVLVLVDGLPLTASTSSTSTSSVARAERGRGRIRTARDNGSATAGRPWSRPASARRRSGRRPAAAADTPPPP